MHVLVVDDDAMAAAIVAMVLEDAGYEVTVAESGDEALPLFAEHPDFDLVISDQNMPGIDGIELFQKLRMTGLTVPFILLSGDDPEKLRKKSPEISRFLAKDDVLADIIADTVTQLLIPVAR
jgi:CheY-like chemotaxis protein